MTIMTGNPLQASHYLQKPEPKAKVQPQPIGAQAASCAHCQVYPSLGYVAPRAGSLRGGLLDLLGVLSAVGCDVGHSLVAEESSLEAIVSLRCLLVGAGRLKTLNPKTLLEPL